MTVRYAVVGLGHIAQAAVLPSFEHAGENSELAALVSDDPVKLKTLGRRYGVEALYSYAKYDELLKSGKIDAVYIALPNSLHAEFAVRAARRGVHVLCEKPLAVTEEECRLMIYEARDHHVKLMTAYRLHFEDANMEAVRVARSGRIGEPRYFSSTFSMQVRAGDIRLRSDLGGGTLYDIGIYCINAARYLFQDEPREVSAFSRSGGDARFRQVDESTAAVLSFSEGRLASFTSSFGAADVSSYRLVGTKGDLVCEPAYEYEGDLRHYVTIGGKTKKRDFPARDQFAPELVYFSDCVLDDEEPEPSGEEGLADVRVIEALYRSARERRPIALPELARARRPGPELEMRRPAVRGAKLVHTRPPHR
jgi:predicted dehydrogenase